MERMRKAGKNLEDVQEMNRAVLIEQLRKKGQCTRAILAKETGLQQATVSNIINDFIRCGLVRETGFVGGEKGRRSIGVTLNAEAFKTIGVKLTRNYITVGLFDIAGKQYKTEKYTIDMSGGSVAAMELMKRSIQKLLEESRGDQVIGIGVATPGPFMRSEGRIILMSEFPGWEKIHIIDELKEAFTMPVLVEHDANCCAVAEWWIGKHRRDTGTMMTVIVGQGIGAGIVVDGKLLLGSMGIAGEIGHMSIDRNGERCRCGNRGCLYKYCSTITLIHDVAQELVYYPESILNEDSSIEAIYRAIRAEDPLAVKVLDKAAWNLGFGLANAVNAYNPNVIILCDEMTQSGPRLLEKVKESIQEHILPELYEKLTVEYSDIENDTALMGAGYAVANMVLKTPSTLMHQEE